MVSSFQGSQQLYQVSKEDNSWQAQEHQDMFFDLKMRGIHPNLLKKNTGLVYCQVLDLTSQFQEDLKSLN